MYVRAALLLAVFQQALGGGGGTLQLIKFRPDAITTEQLGYDDDHYRCGVNVTPDYIQGCVYTDCFTSKKYDSSKAEGERWTNGPHKLAWVTNSDNDATASWDANAKRARRRLGAKTTPFAYDGLDDYTSNEIPDCGVNPTAGAHWEVDADGNMAGIPGEGNWSDCPVGNNKIPIDTLGEVPGDVEGDHVCTYASAQPKETVGTVTEYCLCKTVRCRVATMEDGSLGADGTGQKYGQCNFNVRVETAHAVPYVPAYWMWIIFGFSLAVAAMTSGFFILMYGSAAHHHGGHGGGHGDKHGGEDKPATDE